MWICEQGTFSILAVNAAAQSLYGFSQEEFLAMSFLEICPDLDSIDLEPDSGHVAQGQKVTERHRLKSGRVLDVEIWRQKIDHDGTPAELVSARHISDLGAAWGMQQQAGARKEAAHDTRDALVVQFQKMFGDIQGMFLVFSPESFHVVAVSDEFLNVTGLVRHDVVGKTLFEALPIEACDTTHDRLQNSFERVLQTGKADMLELLGFHLPGMSGRPWSVAITPVAGPDEKVIHLMLRMQDITVSMEPRVMDAPGDDGGAVKTARIDLFAQTRELKSDNLRLAELATRLRTTQRLLGTGTWDYIIAEDRLEFSDNVYAMYGISPEDFGHGFNDYIALIHPDDRLEMRNALDAFLSSVERYLSFEHKVLLEEGRIVHIHGVLERMDTVLGPSLCGVVQDVTETVEASNALARAKRMLEIAGTSAKFGAWHYDVQADKGEWSSQVARIHDEPDGFTPSFYAALGYFVPGDQERMLELVTACRDEGKPFDVTVQVVTAKHRKIWARVTAEAVRDEAGRITSLCGSMQDVSELVSIRARAEESEGLLEVAGRAVRLGGWRVSLADHSVSWTDGIAAIHELPAGTRPTLQSGIDYFAPEERDDARKVFEDCAKYGIPFNDVRDLITSKGNRVTVRSVGEPVFDDSGKIVAVQGAMQDVSELIHAQKKADELATRLAETLENIGDAFFTLDREWRFTYLNDLAQRLLEKPKNMLLEQPIFEQFPELINTEFDVKCTRAFKTGETVRFEQNVMTLDRRLRINAHPAPNGLAVYFVDITQEHARNEQLRLLDAAVRNINDIVVITDLRNLDEMGSPRIVYVNDAFERLTGFSREEVIGFTPRLLHGPKTDRAELGRIRAAAIARQPVRAELINYTKSGNEYWLEIDVVPLSNEAGAFTHLVAVQREITSRRNAEEALRISEMRFRFIAHATGIAIWEWDVKEARLWWSDGMLELFGYTPEPDRAVRDVWRANVHSDDLSRVEESLERLLSGQTDAVLERYRFWRVDDAWAHIESRAFLIRDDKGAPLRILGSMVDISDRLEMEERLRQSQKLEAVGQLTGGVAHDFNNLLTIILGNTELLQERLEDTHELRKFADMIAMASDRAAELTNRLLAFSRKQALQPQIVKINAVLDGIEEMLRRTLGEDIDIQIHREDDLWATEVDLSQLESALLNLAINSRDAMPDGGSLTIETANVTLDDDYVSNELGVRPGQYVVISVTDTGIGISKDKIDRVFEPFFTTKDIGKGTGLGLSMVYGFLKQTGGHIRIYSEANEGTVVKLYFPRLQGEQTEVGPERETSIAQHGQETILVVEDDSMILQQLMAQLTGLGYKVVTASSGTPALAILRERSDIDLLFTDVVLPGGMNGRQIAEAAQEIRPGLKVLYTSGYSENAIIHHGRLDRGVELLSKPYRRSELAAKLRKVIES